MRKIEQKRMRHSIIRQKWDKQTENLNVFLHIEREISMELYEQHQNKNDGSGSGGPVTRQSNFPLTPILLTALIALIRSTSKNCRGQIENIVN